MSIFVVIEKILEVVNNIMLINRQIIVPLGLMFRSIFRCSIENITSSNFHLIGPKKFNRSRDINKLLGNNLIKINSLQENLQQCRKTTHKSNLTLTLEGSKQLQSYQETYKKFVSAIESLQINNEWIYNVIGWYNIRSLRKLLVLRMLQANQAELKVLIEPLTWMSKQNQGVQSYFQSEQAMRQSIELFYRKLAHNWTINELKDIEYILKIKMEHWKTKYYDIYSWKNIDQLIKEARRQNNQMVKNLIWLFHQLTLSMIDNDMITSKIQKFLITSTVEIGSEQIQQLMAIYRLKGRINQKVYQMYIKDYLLALQKRSIEGLIDVFAFLVYSEVNDNQYLRKCIISLKTLDESKKKSIKVQYLNKAHVIYEYLKIKFPNTKFDSQVLSLFSDQCKASRQKCLNRAIFKKWKQSTKKTIPISNKYFSNCLNGADVTEPMSFSQKEKLISSYGSRLLSFDVMNPIYKNHRFCSFPLEYCVFKAINNEVWNVETKVAEYKFQSGRMKREIQVRDLILNYYNIKVMHIYSEYIKTKEFKSFKAKNSSV